jgi:hypothetical protein
VRVVSVCVVLPMVRSQFVICESIVSYTMALPSSSAGEGHVITPSNVLLDVRA